MGVHPWEKPLHRPSGLIANAQDSEKVPPCLMGWVRIFFGTARYDLFIKKKTHTPTHLWK